MTMAVAAQPGTAPQPATEVAQRIPLGGALPRAAAVLACGAWFKSTPCRLMAGEALLPAPLGDLDDPDACRRLDAAVEALLALDGPSPQVIAHDLHPDFHSTRLARALAARLGVPAIAVQHHHAHVAAVLAEHGVAADGGPVLGLALDGVGLGSDGSAWGGELLQVHCDAFIRLGHLRALPLAGGDRAAREPWRMAAAALHLGGRAGEVASRFAQQPAAAQLAQVLARPALCPPAFGLGRWFDAAAGLLGVCAVMRFEAEAAIALERLAAAHGPVAPERDGYHIDDNLQLDLLPLLLRLADESDAARGAARFHHTLVAALLDWSLQAAQRASMNKVVLSGGCFHNRILSVGLAAGLRDAGLTVLEARALSPGDAGLALGQAWVAAHRLAAGAEGMTAGMTENFDGVLCAVQ